MPTVSVILPTHNRVEMLGQAIDSVLGQSFADLELLVVDDGSDDGTSARLASPPDRVRLLRQDRGGPARARNLGLDAAAGEFIAFLDSDDLWEPDKIERQLAELRRDPGAGAVCTDATEWIGGAREPLTFFERIGFTGEVTPEAMFRENPVAIQSLLARRRAVAAAGRFDPGLCGTEDYDFAFRLLRAAPIRTLFRPLVRRRLLPERVSGDRRRMARDALVTLERALVLFPQIGPRLGRRVDRRFARLHLDLAYGLLLAHDFPQARRRLRQALRRDPALWKAWWFLAASFLGPAGFHRLRSLRRPPQGSPATAPR